MMFSTLLQTIFPLQDNKHLTIQQSSILLNTPGRSPHRHSILIRQWVTRTVPHHSCKLLSPLRSTAWKNSSAAVDSCGSALLLPNRARARLGHGKAPAEGWLNHKSIAKPSKAEQEWKHTAYFLPSCISLFWTHILAFSHVQHLPVEVYTRSANVHTDHLTFLLFWHTVRPPHPHSLLPAEEEGRKGCIWMYFSFSIPISIKAWHWHCQG